MLVTFSVDKTIVDVRFRKDTPQKKLAQLARVNVMVKIGKSLICMEPGIGLEPTTC